MRIRRVLAVLLLPSTLLTAPMAALAQEYPSRPIRIVTSPIGGSPDFVARIVAQASTGSLGQNIIIDNRPNGITQAQIVAGAPPDGYTLLLVSNVLWVEPLMKETPYDPVRDFAPVTLTNRSTLILAVHPSLPIASVKELVAYASAHPGQLNYASGASGTASHLAAELFKSMAGVNFVRIPYKGSGLATTDLLSGRVQLSFFSPTSVIPHIKTGKLRALAVTSPQQSKLLPGVPTVAETLPGYEAGSTYGLFAPARTPAAVVNRWHDVTVRFLRTEEAKERFLKVGSETVGSTPREFADYIKAEIARWSKLIKVSGIRAD
jgi:tripartite-type tricarboxylate transporter receptor subunit TctC